MGGGGLHRGPVVRSHGSRPGSPGIQPGGPCSADVEKVRSHGLRPGSHGIPGCGSSSSSNDGCGGKGAGGGGLSHGSVVGTVRSPGRRPCDETDGKGKKIPRLFGGYGRGGDSKLMADAIAYGWEMAGVQWKRVVVEQAVLPAGDGVVVVELAGLPAGDGVVVDQAGLPDNDVVTAVSADCLNDFEADEEAARWLNDYDLGTDS